MSGECVISLVLSHHSKRWKRQTSVTARLQLSFIWQAKENTSSRREGGPTQKKRREVPLLNFGSSFYMFFLLPLSLPCVNWPGQEGCLFYLRSSLRCLDLPLFYFCGLLATTFWTPYVNWASQEGYLFYLSSSLPSLDLPLFYFVDF